MLMEKYVPRTMKEEYKLELVCVGFCKIQESVTVRYLSCNIAIK